MNWILATRGQKISRASWRMHRSDILPIKNLLHSSRVLRAASSFIYFVFLSTGVVTVSHPRKCVLNQNNELQEASVFCRAVKWWIHVPGGLIITPVFFWLPGPTCCIGRIMRKRECCSIVSFSKKHLKSNCLSPGERSYQNILFHKGGLWLSLEVQLSLLCELWDATHAAG